MAGVEVTKYSFSNILSSSHFMGYMYILTSSTFSSVMLILLKYESHYVIYLITFKLISAEYNLIMCILGDNKVIPSQKDQ